MKKQNKKSKIEEKLLLENSTFKDVLKRFGENNIYSGNLSNEIYHHLTKHFQHTERDIRIKELNNVSEYLSNQIINNYLLINKKYS